MNYPIPVLMALFGWIPAVFLLFAFLTPRRAVITAYLLAWLFLPVAGISLPGLPDYTKITATNFLVFAAVAIYDGNRLFAFRPRIYDLPMLLWCLFPFASSISNGLGVYDGLSAVVSQVFMWGLPYLIGRVYFNNLEGARDLAVGIFIGGLIYIPFCLWEIRMSPQLHRLVYGFHQHTFMQSYRFGGWRPMVFMQHGLMVGMWMTSASIAGVWLWLSGSVKRIMGMPVGWLLVPLLATTLLCKSVGALILLMLGILTILSVRWLRTAVPLLCLILIVPGYMLARTTGIWSGDNLVTIASTVVNEGRAASLKTRLDNEDMLIDKALRQPLFGWGRWGRSRVQNYYGEDQSITDGQWIISLGEAGIAGLTTLTLAMLIPPLLLWWKLPPRFWKQAAYASAVVLGVLVTLYMIDNLLNAMFNPIYVLAAGGLVGLFAQFKPVAARQTHRRRVRRVKVRQQSGRAAHQPVSTPEVPPAATGF